MSEQRDDRKPHGITILYFHGASSTVDRGPSDDACAAAGIRIVRNIRPGYAGIPRSEGSLADVARQAVEHATGDSGPVVVMGWSGGGPYALAAGAVCPNVCGVGLLNSWAPMDPPAKGLPITVRAFMHLGRRVPRTVLRIALAAVGFRNPGHADDVHRIARPWQFDIGDIAARVPVAVWHAEGDHEVPIGPWRTRTDISLTTVAGSAHHPSAETWDDALRWAATIGRAASPEIPTSQDIATAADRVRTTYRSALDRLAE